jgi:5-hydroxyisourate hydrolase
MISTHILDTSLGSPASGVGVRLEYRTEAGVWSELSAGVTNTDGRFVFSDLGLPGTYQIVFEVEPYFIREQTESFFPAVSVVFRIKSTERKYHVPLLLNPYGYSTYRGS